MIKDTDVNGAAPVFSAEFVRSAMALLDPMFVLSESAEAEIAAILSRRAAELLLEKEQRAARSGQ